MAYVPHTPEDVRAMLEVIGVDSIDDLFAGLPENVRLKEPLAMADGLSEEEVLREFRRAAARNQGLDSLTSFLGGGMYDCAIPAAVDAIAGRSEFLTAYTPYQPEVSQGTLQVIYEWQTFICRLTGLDVANASMYDGATALSEAVMLTLADRRGKSVVLPATLNPRYQRVVRTTMRGMGYTVKVAPAGADGRVDVEALAGLMDDGVGTVVVQNPNYLGQIEDVDAIAAVAREHKAHLVAAVNPVSLSVLKIPAEYGASVAVGEAQPFGVPVSWGGPLLGFMACVDKLKRRLPGRVVGATRDNRGQSGYVLTLQTREQHIRREKATSNICSNQGLNALKATVYLSMLGTEGYRELGEANLIRAAALKRAVSAVEGVTLPYPGPVFNEMVLRLSRPAAGFRAFARERGVLAGIDLKDFAVGGENDLLVAVTEKRTAGEIDHLAALLDAYLNDKEVR
ncbi:aminomethyl-transferring glycine dehydrogenase [bacterium DOLZORAL124_64_63]|nr:MAG: aminomethyl-transferring glycine dehydrogenase [bacterium DOLZORAL124_64_63]